MTRHVIESIKDGDLLRLKGCTAWREIRPVSDAFCLDGLMRRRVAVKFDELKKELETYLVEGRPWYEVRLGA